MIKFSNMDVIAALEKILKHNTAFYQDDFKADKKFIRRAAKSDKQEDKTLVWVSRPCGTYCFREEDLFLRDTTAYQTLMYYYETDAESFLVYAVEVTGVDGRTIMGDVYVLDYPSYCENLKRRAAIVASRTLVYATEERTIAADAKYNSRFDPEGDNLLYIRYNPENQEDYKHALWDEKHKRLATKEGDFEAYIEKLRTAIFFDEANRIKAENKSSKLPNDEDGSVTVDLSWEFRYLIKPRARKRLLGYLPAGYQLIDKYGDGESTAVKIIAKS